MGPLRPLGIWSYDYPQLSFLPSIHRDCFRSIVWCPQLYAWPSVRWPAFLSQHLGMLPRYPLATHQLCCNLSLLHAVCNCQLTWLYASKYTFKRQDTFHLTWPFAAMYAPVCWIERLAELQTPGTGRWHIAGSVWLEVHMSCGICLVAGAVRWLKSWPWSIL